MMRRHLTLATMVIIQKRKIINPGTDAETRVLLHNGTQWLYKTELSKQDVCPSEFTAALGTVLKTRNRDE